MSKKKATKKAPRRRPAKSQVEQMIDEELRRAHLGGASPVELDRLREKLLRATERKKERDAYEDSLKVPMAGAEFRANMFATPLIQRVSPSDPQPGYEIASNTERMMRNMDLVATALTTQAEASRLLAVALLDSNIRTTR